MTITLQAVNELIKSLESAGELSIKETKVMALAKAFKQLAAENVGLKVERAEMVAIGELIRTQDNRITDQPLFAVMAKREIITSEDHDYDRICWVENQSGDYVEATDTQRRRLEAIYQRRYEVRDGWDRYAMKEIDVFVTGCFTEQGCKDYISRNGHNLNKPFIYAFGSYRNNEYQSVRKFIMGIPETPATDRIVAGIKASAIPEGFKLVPEQMYLSAEDIQAICMQCGNGDKKGYGDYEDGILWVGELSNDGEVKYGLNIANANYPEEGSITVFEFDEQLREGADK